MVELPGKTVLGRARKDASISISWLVRRGFTAQYSQLAQKSEPELAKSAKPAIHFPHDPHARRDSTRAIFPRATFTIQTDLHYQ